jgi:hypothetical protein
MRAVHLKQFLKPKCQTTGILAALALAVAAIALAGCASPTERAIRVSEQTLFGDMECFRVETPSATYLYGKRGAGFARILDPDGHDWIGYAHGGKARGEYRGLPKCGQPVKYFHCGYGFGQYTNDNPFTSTVIVNQAGHARIHSETRHCDAACDWDFYSSHATLTLQRCGTNGFWFLYEGTPGGELQVSGDFVVRSTGEQSALSQPWEAATPWVVFGAAESPWGLWMANHDPTTATASYVSWPYQPEPDGGLNQMTVFGWGRPDWRDPRQHTPQLRLLPAKFSIGFVQGTDTNTVGRAVTRSKLQSVP